MSKEKQTEEKKEKVLTKYDRKMERRKEEEEKDRKSWMQFKIGSLAVVVIIAAAAVFSIGSSVYGKYSATHNTYVKIGNHNLTKAEYDCYFNSAVNSYLQMYGSYVSMMGLDPNADLESQAYPGNDMMTWKDYFDQSTVEQITQVKALADDAAANKFDYDDTEDMEEFQASVEAGAKEASVSVSEYYTSMYGEYATASMVESMVRESFLANAYYTYLTEQNAPSEEEISSYYEENKDSYDLVDYRSFYFESDSKEGASEEEKASAMEGLKARADEMAERRKGGEDFEALCKEYAAEDAKENYGGETDGSLAEDARNYATPSAATDWLFDESRKNGDLTVLSDENTGRCYVVEFLARKEDKENTDTAISNTLSGEAAGAYLREKMDQYEVTDVTGDLKYLLMDVSSDGSAQAEETESDAETQSGEEE